MYTNTDLQVIVFNAKLVLLKQAVMSQGTGSDVKMLRGSLIK